MLFKQGSSENDGRSDVFDRSEFKVISNCCYNNCCRTNCSSFTCVYLNLSEFTWISLNLPKIRYCPALVQPLIVKSGRLYNRLVVWCRRHHTFDRFDVTLAYEDAQVNPPGWDDGRSEDYLWTIWGFSEDFLRTLWGLSEYFLRISWGLSEDYLWTIWEFSVFF